MIRHRIDVFGPRSHGLLSNLVGVSAERTDVHVVHATMTRWVLLRRDECVALAALTDVSKVRWTESRAR